jgi:hypothetical protein
MHETDNLYWNRLELCLVCPEYLGSERCKRLELGCRNAFRMSLDSPLAVCPVGVWRAVVDFADSVCDNE